MNANEGAHRRAADGSPRGRLPERFFDYEHDYEHEGRLAR